LYKNVVEGYYISGKKDKAFFLCKNNENDNQNRTCTSISKPKARWYINGDPDKNSIQAMI